MANLTTPGHVTSSRPANSSAEEPEASSAGADGSWASTSDSHTQHELPRLHFGPFPYKVVLAYYIFLWLLNCVFPIVMYYPLQAYTDLSRHALFGISSALLGVSSSFDAPWRLYKLWKYDERYGALPINEKANRWWQLDFSMWFYTLCMAFFVLPLAIAPALELYSFFLFSTGMLIGPAVVVLLLSLVPLRYPFRLSSQPSGTSNKPAAFYVLEDIGAVDFRRGREWRRAVRERWNVSQAFRFHLRLQTLYWATAGAIYVGATAAVAWVASLNFAFVFVLGQFFLWIPLACFGSYLLGRWCLKRERDLWAQR